MTEPTRETKEDKAPGATPHTPSTPTYGRSLYRAGRDLQAHQVVNINTIFFHINPPSRAWEEKKEEQKDIGCCNRFRKWVCCRK